MAPDGTITEYGVAPVNETLLFDRAWGHTEGASVVVSDVVYGWRPYALHRELLDVVTWQYPLAWLF